jgi:hypothetical protein
MSAESGVMQAQIAPSFVAGLHHRLQRQFQVQVADWQDTCRELADWEDRNLVSLPSADRLAEHALMLENLERVGRWLVTASSQAEFGDSQTLAQIQFTLQDLHDTRAMWHGQVSESHRREILQDCFHES